MNLERVIWSVKWAVILKAVITFHCSGMYSNNDVPSAMHVIHGLRFIAFNENTYEDNT